MWRPPVNFITLHYAYIIFLGILGIVVLYPYGNLAAIDAYFMGVSASTESGLNSVDLKVLKTYQQLFLYFIPIVSNLGFINIIVVVVRLYWFEKRLKDTAPTALRAKPHPRNYGLDQEAQASSSVGRQIPRNVAKNSLEKNGSNSGNNTSNLGWGDVPENPSNDQDPQNAARQNQRIPRISFAEKPKALYIPSPLEQDRGETIREVDEHETTENAVDSDRNDTKSEAVRRRLRDGLSSSSVPIERVTSSMFVLGASTSRAPEPRLQHAVSLSKDSNIPGLSSQASLGRNSQFYNLTTEDRERLGGIEYRSLKLLLKIVIGYFFGLHPFGAICLAGWIQHADPKYRNYLQECGQSKTWWGFYSAQTMVDNLGLTLTPDSMVSFQDATFPMLLMSFLAYAGNTLYPCVLRLVIWIIFKCTPKNSSLHEPLEFLLTYPRRCYTLLFRSKPTWILFGIIFVLNFVDVLLIVLLDLNNPAVNNLPGGPRVLAAIFQAASSRHTGTSTFNLADVNPAVQLSLLVMMYIAVFPIAISIRASNTYEERTLGMYSKGHDLDENNGTRYVLSHMRNQLSFDLWYMFLGIFCLCISESDRIMNPSDRGFDIFAMFFECVSAYGNVGLSLGYSGTTTSLSGEFNTFSKVVICLMMIRGRHRGLPYQIDRAILLPSERLIDDDQVDVIPTSWNTSNLSTDAESRLLKVKRYHTK